MDYTSYDLLDACLVLDQVEKEEARKKMIRIIEKQSTGVQNVLKEIFSVAQDWYRHYGIQYIPGANGREEQDKTFDDFLVFVRSLENKTCELSPQEIANWLSSYPPVVSKWLLKAVKKDLTCGISYKTSNKIWPGLISTFDCQLADVYVNGMKIGFPIAVEPKIDGVRCITIVKADEVEFISRSGNYLYNCEDIGAEILDCTKKLEKPFILDGELFSGNFHETMSTCRSSVNRPSQAALDKMKLIVFDYMSLDDWQRKECLKTYIERRKTLIFNLPKEGKVYFNQMKVADTEQELEAFYNLCLEQGFEGAVIKRLEGRYAFYRSSSWLKYKPWQDGDFYCTKVFEGEGRNKDRLGAIQIYTGKAYCDVGTGFSDDQREFFWFVQDNIVGKIVEVKYKELTEDGLLREPVFVRIRDDKEVEDVNG